LSVDGDRFITGYAPNITDKYALRLDLYQDLKNILQNDLINNLLPLSLDIDQKWMQKISYG
jgi:hypothetical protein